MAREFKNDRDCADCLCRVCARNQCFDNYNPLCDYKSCDCTCQIGDTMFETEEDCARFLPDEDSEND